MRMRPPRGYYGRGRIAFSFWSPERSRAIDAILRRPPNSDGGKTALTSAQGRTCADGRPKYEFRENITRWEHSLDS